MSEATLTTLIRRISRLFYCDLSCIVIDYLCKHKKLEDNTFAKEYDLKPNDVRGALNNLRDDGFLKKMELNRKQVDDSIKMSVTKTTTFMQWSFNTDLMNVLKYRIMKLKQSVDKKIDISKREQFVCDPCDREYDSMEVYQRNYQCPFCEKPLRQKEKPCKDPEKLRKESNRIFSSFELAIKALDEFSIPREFFGYEVLRKPNFNLPDNVAIKGFKNNQLSSMKLKPNVNLEFETLRTDVYKDPKMVKPEILKKSRKEFPELYSYYEKRTKDRIVKNVKSLGKKMNKRKKKEAHKKLLESGEYQEKYKQYMSKLIDI